MNPMRQLHKAIWASLLIFSCIRFACDVHSVTHFSAMIATGLPLLLAIWSENKSSDVSFHAILVYTLCAVASAISLAQWKVLNEASPIDALIPLCSGIVWFSHQRREKHEG